MIKGQTKTIDLRGCDIQDVAKAIAGTAKVLSQIGIQLVVLKVAPPQKTLIRSVASEKSSY